jgi:hypothetical protein
MKLFPAIRQLVAVTALLSLLATPVLAAPATPRDDPRERVIAKLVKAAKQLFGISTTGDFPTVPRP